MAVTIVRPVQSGILTDGCWAEAGRIPPASGGATSIASRTSRHGLRIPCLRILVACDRERFMAASGREPFVESA